MNHIKVCCRIRPPLDRNEEQCLWVIPGEQPSVIAGTLSYQLDYVFDFKNTQEEIFNEIVRPIVVDSFTGFNCSLFTYGQTGSGKTHTLFGSSTDDIERGIIPRSAELIFQTKKSLETEKSCQIKLSILEIYQEKLKDLLGDNNFNRQQQVDNSLRIREQIDGTVWIENLCEININNENEFCKLLNGAIKRRVVGSHNMNNVSSRSHLCCIFSIIQVDHNTHEKIISKLHIIDLAGSEMARKTDATGVRFSEAKHINKSLSALGNVIFALSSVNQSTITNELIEIPNKRDNQNIPMKRRSISFNPLPIQSENSEKKYPTTTNTTSRKIAVMPKLHIPYRDSKLTRLLQNSLGGNAKTIIILTLSSSKQHLQESLSTLKFGDRARQVQLKAIINKALSDDDVDLKRVISLANIEISSLKQTIIELQEEIIRSSNNANTTLQSNQELICDLCQNLINESIPTILQNVNDDYQLLLSTPPLPTHRQLHSQDSLFDDIKENISNDSLHGNESLDMINKSDRCAICGLNDEEADSLLLDTGESLGELFTCDGNCGDKFHVRCVGLVGEGGQYTLPEGEWFCTQCVSLVETDFITDKMNSLHYMSKYHSKPTTPATSEMYQIELKNDFSKNPDTMRLIASIKAEYHMMRRERNRILSHWQQEKKIQLKLENNRKNHQKSLDIELINAKDQIKNVEMKLQDSIIENKRLQNMMEIMMKEFQQNSITNNNNNNNNNNGIELRNSNKMNMSINKELWSDYKPKWSLRNNHSTDDITETSPTSKQKTSPNLLQTSKSIQDIPFHHMKIVDENTNNINNNNNNNNNNDNNNNNNNNNDFNIDQSKNGSFEEKVEKEKLKFINPLRNRLKELLKTVQDEAGSFEEIRQKYKVRSDDIKSSQN
eukprot:gene5059-7061_t